MSLRKLNRSASGEVCFWQRMAGSQLAIKRLISHARPFWLMLVVVGCVGLLSIGFSTGFAQWLFASPSLDPKHWAMTSCLVVGLITTTPVRRGHRKIVIYARYSTEEQHPSSIDDQIRFCRRQLEQRGIVGDITVISDPEISGETLSRPGLDQLRAGVEARQWDLITCEDSSRLFRAPTPCANFVERAVDGKIQVLCPNDKIDTCEEGWDQRLRAAQEEHANANNLTRSRIQRTAAGLWERGAAVTVKRAGLIRTPTSPASFGKAAEGPFYDTLDSQWIQVIHEGYERIAAGEMPWAVALWLASTGLLNPNSQGGTWNAGTVISLIRSEIYRGVERHGKITARLQFTTRKKILEPNDEANIWERSVEHLRIVPDWLWYKANQAIDARAVQSKGRRGEEHPLFQIPRDSRGPLSTLFVCGICGAKMYIGSRRGDAYRCSASRDGTCWNKATALLSRVHPAISDAIALQLLKLDGLLDVLIQHASLLQQERPNQQAQEDALRAALRIAERKCKNYREAIGASEESITELLADLTAALSEREAASAKLEELLAASKPLCPATPDELRASIAQCRSQLLEFSPTVSGLLRRILVGKIAAVPYQQFGGNKVVLRAEFTLRLANLLPTQLQDLLQGRPLETNLSIEEVGVKIDLFEPSGVPKNAVAAAELAAKNMSVIAMAKELEVSRQIAHRASTMGKAMHAAGVADPFIRLTEAPAAASRWRNRPEHSETSCDVASPMEASDGTGENDFAA